MKKLNSKELIIHAGKGMSLQRHFNRDEIWFVSKENVMLNIKGLNKKNNKLKN